MLMRTWARAAVGTVATLALLSLVACGGGKGSGSGGSAPAGAGGTPLAAVAGGTSAPSGGSLAGAPGASVAPGAHAHASARTSATPAPTRKPFATAMTASGQARVQAPSTGAFVITGSTCGAGGGQADFFFGNPGSGEEVEVVIHSGYNGPGTYSATSADASVSVGHSQRTWYGQFSTDSGASITVDAGGRSGTFSFPSQVQTKETVTGTFVCG
jgi:hypothetical protein